MTTNEEMRLADIHNECQVIDIQYYGSMLRQAVTTSYSIPRKLTLFLKRIWPSAKIKPVTIVRFNCHLLRRKNSVTMVGSLCFENTDLTVDIN